MEPSNFQTLMDSLFARMERQEAQATVANQALLDLVGEARNLRQDGQKFQQQQGQFNLRMLEWIDRQEQFNDRQEKFSERQEKFNERQDQFNIIFLDEIRGMKKDHPGPDRSRAQAARRPFETVGRLHGRPDAQG